MREPLLREVWLLLLASALTPLALVFAALKRAARVVKPMSGWGEDTEGRRLEPVPVVLGDHIQIQDPVAIQKCVEEGEGQFRVVGDLSRAHCEGPAPGHAEGLLEGRVGDVGLELEGGPE